MNKQTKKGTPYSENELQYIRGHWQQMTDAEVGRAIGRPAGGITAQRRKMGFRNYSRSEWTPAEEQLVRELYADHENESILEQLPRHDMQALYRKAHGLGLKKSDAFREAQQRRLGKALAETDAAKAGRFAKGQQPFNKGMSQQDFMSAEAIERTKATRFKKGHTPANTKWDGAITIRHHHPERGEKPSVWIRLSKGRWEKYTRYQYRKHCGPIPEGKLVALKDGNPFNCFPENLELITRAENALRNRNWQKAMETMERQGNHPSRHLTDPFVASMVAGHDEQVKNYILSERPDIIQTARAHYQLQRQIRDCDE